MAKRVTSVLLALLLCVSMGALSVFAASPRGGVAVAVVTGAGVETVAASEGDMITMVQTFQSLALPGRLVETLWIEGTAPAQITINIPGLTAADRVYIVHLLDSGRVERIPAVSRDGTASFWTNSYSLFGVVVEKGAGGTNAGSPQTGVYN